MDAPFDYAVTAGSLLRYFERQEAAEGVRWTSGRVAAETWSRALEPAETSAGQLAELDRLMSAGSGDPSSAWIEMQLAYRSWRERRGS